jgi:hypothetical protein
VSGFGIFTKDLSALRIRLSATETDIWRCVKMCFCVCLWSVSVSKTECVYDLCLYETSNVFMICVCLRQTECFYDLCLSETDRMCLWSVSIWDRLNALWGASWARRNSWTSSMINNIECLDGRSFRDTEFISSRLRYISLIECEPWSQIQITVIVCSRLRVPRVFWRELACLTSRDWQRTPQKYCV